MVESANSEFRNLRSDSQIELKEANRAWTNCVSNTFLPKWLAGEKLNVEEVCREEHERMNELNDAAFEESPNPIRRWTLPASQWLRLKQKLAIW